MFALWLPLLSALAAEEPVAQPTAALRWSPDTTMAYRYSLRSDLTLSLDAIDHLERMTGTFESGEDGTVPFADFRLDAVLDCRSDDSPGERVALVCTVDTADLASDGARTAADRATLDDLAIRLEEAVVDIGLSPQGRLRTLDVTLQEPQQEMLDIIVRELMLRATSGFDLELPDAADERRWTQRRSAFTRTTAGFGPLARAELTHRRMGQFDTAAIVQSRGLLSHLIFDTSGRATRIGDAEVASVAVFDTSLGVLSERSWTVQDLGDNPYDQVGSLALMDVVPAG